MVDRNREKASHDTDTLNLGQGGTIRMYIYPTGNACAAWPDLPTDDRNTVPPCLEFFLIRAFGSAT